MESLSWLGLLVRDQASSLTVLGRLVEQSANDTIDVLQPWGRRPGGTGLSALSRMRLSILAPSDDDLRHTGIELGFVGSDDWVRVQLPGLEATIPLRTRPRSVRRIDRPLELDLDVVRESGHLAVFWRFSPSERRLSHWSMALCESMDWEDGCRVYEEVSIPSVAKLHRRSGLAARIATAAADDLDDLVSRRVPESRSETDVTDDGLVGLGDGEEAAGLVDGA